MTRLLMLVAVVVLCTSVPALDGSSPSSRLPLALPNASVIELRVGIAIPGGGYRVETMALERYVARVVAGEAARDSQPAALEALATTVRTFALANLGRHRADGFDLCDQTHCQVVRVATPATEHAAEATAGRILVRDTTTGVPASIYYTASCGGRTEVPSAVWPGAEDPSFLPSKRDDACGGAPAWTADLSESDLLRAFHAAGFQGHRLENVSIASRDGSGRAAMLKLDGLRPDHISGQDLRVAAGRTLGWQFIKSTAFELRRVGGAYRFSGHGSGHGVGLCVIGSARLAEQGRTAEDILARYFPGLTITGARHVPGTGSTVLPSDRDAGAAKREVRAPGARHVPGTAEGREVALALPEGDEGEREAITRLVTRARDELAATLHVTPPPTLTLRFHPTTDDYERATGQAWFTSATIVGNELHLLPLAVLRDRGVLDRTIRHSLVHALIDSALVNRSLWVREGAATYFGGESPISGHPAERPAFRPSPHASCPADAELANPVSIGALANAYARARTCFARQIDAGKKWQDVR